VCAGTALRIAGVHQVVGGMPNKWEFQVYKRGYVGMKKSECLHFDSTKESRMLNCSSLWSHVPYNSFKNSKYV
jgi:hypothetical protein